MDFVQPIAVVLVESATNVLLARIVDDVGEPIEQADVDYIERTVRNRYTEELVGLAEVEIDVAGAIFDTLQTDPTWDADQTGYNFRDVLPPSVVPTAGVELSIAYRLAMATGGTIVVRFAGPVMESGL